MKNLFKVLANSIRGKNLPEELQGDVGWSTLWGMGGWQKSADSDLWAPLSITEKESAYKIHPIVRACVFCIASSASDCRLEVGSWTSGRDEWQDIPNHPMLELVKNPNPEHDYASFIQLLSTRLSLTGRSHAWKIKNKSGARIVRLWPLPSSWITPIRSRPGEDAIFSGYKITGQSDPLMADEMLSICHFDPASMDQVASALDACVHDYRMDISRGNYQGEMLTNLKMPGVVIKSGPRRLSADQRAMLRSDFANRFGAGKRGEPIILENEGSLEMVNPLGDLDWPGVTSLSETRICAAFHVPPIVASLRSGLEKSTYANYEHARRSFYRETMAPHWIALASSMTRSLLREQGDGRNEFRFRFDELDEFQEDRNSKNDRIIKRFEKGIITREEARIELGYNITPSEGEFREPKIEQIDGGAGDQPINQEVIDAED